MITQAGVKAVIQFMEKNLQPGEAFQAWINCTECVVNYSTWYDVYQHTGLKLAMMNNSVSEDIPKALCKT